MNSRPREIKFNLLNSPTVAQTPQQYFEIDFLIAVA